MSGGHFNYAYFHVKDFVETLEKDLGNPSEYEWVGGLSKETISALKEIAEEAARMAELMRAAEWLFSGDTSEDTFLDTVKRLKS